MKSGRRIILILLALLFLPLGVSAAGIAIQENRHWSTARWDSIGLAPDPAKSREAIIQVYAARVWGWRGAFAVHTWIAVKPENADSFRRFEVVRWSNPTVRERSGQPDVRWAGNEPELLLDIRGERAAELIPRVLQTIADYPHADRYVMWPGPNSNSFTAHIGRAVPELGLALPATAVGKDFIAEGMPIATAPSGQGVQLSLLGLAGITLAPAEGVELNLLGLTLGIDLLRPAIKLPGIGRIGMAAETGPAAEAGN